LAAGRPPTMEPAPMSDTDVPVTSGVYAAVAPPPVQMDAKHSTPAPAPAPPTAPPPQLATPPPRRSSRRRSTRSAVPLYFGGNEAGDIDLEDADAQYENDLLLTVQL